MYRFAALLGRQKRYVPQIHASHTDNATSNSHKRNAFHIQQGCMQSRRHLIWISSNNILADLASSPFVIKNQIADTLCQLWHRQQNGLINCLKNEKISHQIACQFPPCDLASNTRCHNSVMLGATCPATPLGIKKFCRISHAKGRSSLMVRQTAKTGFVFSGIVWWQDVDVAHHLKQPTHANIQSSPLFIPVCVHVRLSLFFGGRKTLQDHTSYEPTLKTTWIWRFGMVFFPNGTAQRNKNISWTQTWQATRFLPPGNPAIMNSQHKFHHEFTTQIQLGPWHGEVTTIFRWFCQCVETPTIKYGWRKAMEKSVQSLHIQGMETCEWNERRYTACNNVSAVNSFAKK